MAVAERGESGGRKGEWDLVMLRRASEGGRMAQRTDCADRKVERRGVDGETFRDIESAEGGLESWLSTLAAELR